MLELDFRAVKYTYIYIYIYICVCVCVCVCVCGDMYSLNSEFRELKLYSK